MIHRDRGDYPAALTYYEKSLKIKEFLGDRKGISQSLHEIGIIHQLCGDYPAALTCYEKSLKIAEELGDRQGIALSLGQMGRLFTKTKRYPEAFESSLAAFSILAQLQSPYAAKAVTNLKDLRKLWGKENFDNAWRTKTGHDVPDYLKDTGENPDTRKQ
jgi:tetratricopeptide (TPR) repeat protein